MATTGANERCTCAGLDGRRARRRARRRRAPAETANHQRAKPASLPDSAPRIGRGGRPSQGAMHADLMSAGPCAARQGRQSVRRRPGLMASGRIGRLSMSTTQGAFDNANAGGFGGSPWSCASTGSRWTPVELIAMVLGFMIFWPFGLAILGYKYWQRKSGGPDLQTVATGAYQRARSAVNGFQASRQGGRPGPVRHGRTVLRLPPATPPSTRGRAPSSPASKRSAAALKTRIANSPTGSTMCARPRTARSSTAS